MVAGILADLNRWHDWWVNTVFSPKQMTINQNTNGTLGPILPPILSSGTKTASSAKSRAYATGTDSAEEGPALVGELGPEIKNLKKGDTITTAAETAKLLDPSKLNVKSKYATVGSQITTGLLDGVTKGSPKLLTKTNDLSTSVAKVFTDLSKASTPSGQSVITSLSTGMKNTTALLNNTTQKLSDGTTSIVNTLIKNSNPLGQNITTALSVGVKATTTNLSNATKSLADNTKTTFTKLATDSNPLGKNVTQGLSDGIKSTTNNVTSIVKTLTDKVITQFNTGFDIHSPSKKLFTIGTQVGQGWINGVKSKDLSGFIKKHITSIIGSFSGGGSASNGQLNAWIMAALGITGTSLSWMGPLQQLINFESGGNPNSINLTDSNAQAGHPSQGLMQTIPSTFATYGIAGLGGITNPIANIVAGIRYIKSRYGDISNTPGMKSIANGGPYMGYANGTASAASGLHWVGEKGPELMNMNGGEGIISNDTITSLINAIKSLSTNSQVSKGTTKTQNINMYGNMSLLNQNDVNSTLRQLQFMSQI